MRVNLRVWRPIARRWGARGLIVAGIVAAAILVGGGGAMALLLGGTGKTVDSSDINLQKGLVGYWNFNGDAKDNTPNGNNGTVNAATLTTDREGKADSAYSFNGTSAYVVTTNSSVLSVTGNVTLSAWVNVTNDGNYQPIISKGSTEYELAADFRTGLTSLQLQQAAGTSNVSAPNFFTGFTGTWVHIAVVTNGTNTFFYRNGVLFSTQAYRTPTTGTDKVLLGGRATGSSLHFKGSIDDPRIYNRALSAAEVAALAKQYDPGVKADAGESGLVGWWKFDGNAKDSSPYAANGTPNLSPTLVADRKGEASSAYRFNGTTNQNISVPDASQLRLNGPFSISFWAEDDGSTTTFPGILAKGNAVNPGAGWLITSFTTNHSICFKRDNASQCTGASAAATTPKHFTYTWDGSTWRWYVSGVQVTSGTQSYATGTGTAVMRIGAGDDPTGNKLTLDDIRIYNRAITVTEVKNISNSYNSQINLLSNPNASPSVNLNVGQIGRWALNGNAKDSTPYAENGTITGATQTTDRKGRANSAYAFNGTSIIDVPPTSLNASYLTVSAWVNPTSASSSQGAVSRYDSAQPDGGWQIGTGASANTFRFYVKIAGSVKSVQAVGTFSINTWYHLVGTYNGTTVTLYVNGVSAGTLAATGPLVASTDHLAIGNRVDMSMGWHGSIDDARVWDRALSQSEVTALYNQYQ